jgi:aryl-alcohol dehydrogenase-like predicted oxidoreductase
MQRREFLTAVAATATGYASPSAGIPRRPYKDGIELSMIGFGGIVVVGQDQAAADHTVAAAFERGVNYFDVAPSYFDGEAEIKLGNSLKPYRSKVFLACKTLQRDAQGAEEELKRSLDRLHTDHFDLYQFHAVTTMKDVDAITGRGGAAELFLKAKRDGRIRYAGFSAHNPKAAIALMDRFPADSVLFPVNFVTWTRGDFGPQILEAAKGKGIRRLALKAMAYTKWPETLKESERPYPKCWYKPVDDRDLAGKAVRFTLSQEITAAIPPGDERLFNMALDIAANYRPLSDEERQDLFAHASAVEPIFRA